jgi:hypothetical protein
MFHLIGRLPIKLTKETSHKILSPEKLIPKIFGGGGNLHKNQKIRPFLKNHYDTSSFKSPNYLFLT